MRRSTVLVITQLCLMLQLRAVVSKPAKGFGNILDISQEDVIRKMQPMIARACNVVSLGVYKELTPNYDNMAISPFSICSLLAVCLRASKRATHSELKRKLILKLTFRAELTDVYASVYKSFRDDKYVNISTSNVMLVNKDVQLVEDAVDDYRKSFNGSVGTFDPEMKELTSNQMNEIVSSAVGGLVTGDLKRDDVSSEHALFLINTLQLNARWKDQFDTDNTYPMKFYVDPDKFVHTDTMNRRGFYRWKRSHNLKCEILEIPYEGDRFAMYIILPFEKDGLKQLEKKLTHKNMKLETEFAKLKKAREIEVYLPKFSIKQTFSMKDALVTHNIKTLFDEKKADLSALIQGGKVFIRDALQSSTVEVNEMGTVAGTYSLMMGELFSQPQIFHASHPFMYVLRDRQTDFNIFMGKYAKP